MGKIRRLFEDEEKKKIRADAIEMISNAESFVVYAAHKSELEVVASLHRVNHAKAIPERMRVDAAVIEDDLEQKQLAGEKI